MEKNNLSLLEDKSTSQSTAAANPQVKLNSTIDKNKKLKLTNKKNF